MHNLQVFVLCTTERDHGSGYVNTSGGLCETFKYKHILLRPMDFQLLAATVQTQNGKQIAVELVKLEFVVTCFRQYEVEVKEQELLHEQQKNKALENDIKDQGPVAMLILS